MCSALRVGLLFGREVVDADGQSIGRVHDVRLRRDGPIIPGFGPALRVEGVVVGPGSIAYRLGLHRPDIAGPWPLDAWGKRAARRARFVPWETIELDEALVRSRQRASDMRSAHE
jgi:hypothetical protein